MTLLLYALVGPPFCLLLVAWGGVVRRPAPRVAVVSVIAAGALALALRPAPKVGDWILPVAIAPTVCCGIAASACGEAGAAFVAVMSAPLAWAAVLFDAPVVVAAWATATGTCFAVLLPRVGPAVAASNTLLASILFALVGWVSHGKSQRLRDAQAELERRRAEAAETLSRNEALVASLPDTIVRADRQGRFLEVHGGSDPLPMPPEQLVGRSVYELVPEEAGKRMSRAIERAIASGAVQTIEYQAPYQGGVRFFESRFARCGPNEVIVVRRDVTAMHRMQQRMAAAERLASVGTLAAGVAHEVNNPLSYVLGNLSYALERLREEPAAPEHAGGALRRELEEPLAEAVQGAERVRAIIRDLRVYARRGDDPPVEMDLRAVVESCLQLVATQLQRRARVVPRLDEAPRVRASEAGVGQVLLILLVNAAQAIGEGDPERNEITVRTGAAPDGRAVVEIGDTGAGIAPSALPHLFEPFFTGKGAGEGSGLGLSICRNLVEALGGEIQVETELGRGSRFRVLLPPAAEEGRHAEEIRHTPAPMSARSAH